ncbi:hypothetical protein KVR01_012960 [Diaporthe batatas]|uniref:uncharacterized protein n=1 Tax=Diaporthe batatas TaxID=748121 RepID=UPI001D0543FD|nr:uncharacterized protein KVR01_012960 [Diaporthe batatas]KAG8157252.1 hypothetical protein KVR01_012960 [Diaporthe batatas]
MVLWGAKYQPQPDLFYVRSGAFLRAKYNTNNGGRYHQYQGFNDAFKDDSTGTSLAGYWPFYAHLDTDHAVAMWHDNPASDIEYSQTGNWSGWLVPDANSMAGSKLAVVPTGTNMTSLSWWRNYGLFYQAITGELAFIQPHKGYAEENNTFIDSWRSDARFPLISLAPGGSFAAFTTARPESSEGLVNTYVLYQEPSSRISTVHLDNHSQWVTTQPAALSIADNGTSIACVTMPMTQRDSYGYDLDLEVASVQANRCYFQREGNVIEVALNGTDWTELGTVPID